MMFFLKIIVRFFFPYGKLRRVISGPLRGLKYYVSPGMGMTYFFGNSDMSWSFFGGKVKEGMFILDVGANRGQMALFFSRFVGDSGKVYCFEPVSHLAEELSRNLLVNKIKNVDVFPYALAESNGVSTFIFSNENSTQGKLKDVEASYVVKNSECISIETRTIDELLKNEEKTPQLLKIDVEGAAALVFKGASELLDHHPDIYLELHGPDEQKAIGDYLVVRGYKFFDMNGNEIIDPVRTWCSPIWCSVSD